MEPPVRSGGPLSAPEADLSPCCFPTGLDAELYYVRDDVVNHYALCFTLPVPSETNSLHFTWHSKTKVRRSTAAPNPPLARVLTTLCLQVDYRLGFHVENPVAMNPPRSNISSQGEVPRVPSGSSRLFFHVTLV